MSCETKITRKTVYVILAQGFEEIEALTTPDILRRNNIKVCTAALNCKDGLTVTGSHKIPVIADMKAEDIGDDIDILVFPGGMPGTTNIDESPMTDYLIEKAHKCHAHIAAICAAPSVLGKRGLLRGKEAICYPGYEKYLTDAKISKKRVVTDGDITTAIGMDASLEFANEILRIAKERREKSDK
ncbi:MAG: DJ-1 family glyoxalase III [Eubacteriales bacterium]|nr:DJ-1 family glyoxalase III [Eubacteriales bacterium]